MRPTHAIDTRGFSLIELLTAIVLLGIIAAISLKVVDARSRAYLAVLKSDLHNLTLAQEAYYYTQELLDGQPEYANSLEELDYTPNQDVEIMLGANKKGWSARATHMKRTDFKCAIYVGDMTAGLQPYDPAVEEGVMECQPKLSKGKGKGAQ